MLFSQAYINQRKHKQIHLFTFTGTLNWKAKNSDEEEVNDGDLIVKEFNQDDFKELEVMLLIFMFRLNIL